MASSSRRYRSAAEGPRCWEREQWKTTVFLSASLGRRVWRESSRAVEGTWMDVLMLPPMWSFFFARGC